MMQLRLTTLGEFAAAHDDVASLRAEDASGGFGIRPGHADFLTVLNVCVVSWHHADGRIQHCALRRGVLRVHRGALIEIAAREAIIDDDLERLESTVLAALRARDEAERSANTEAHRLQLQTLREIMRYLQPERRGLA